MKRTVIIIILTLVVLFVLTHAVNQRALDLVAREVAAPIILELSLCCIAAWLSGRIWRTRSLSPSRRRLSYVIMAIPIVLFGKVFVDLFQIFSVCVSDSTLHAPMLLAVAVASLSAGWMSVRRLISGEPALPGEEKGFTHLEFMIIVIILAVLAVLIFSMLIMKDEPSQPEPREYTAPQKR